LLAVAAAWCVIACLAACIGAVGSRTGVYGKPSVGHGRPGGRAPASGVAAVFGPLDSLDGGSVPCLPRVSKRLFWVFYAVGAPLASVVTVVVLAMARHGPAAAAVFVPVALAAHCWRRLAEHVLAGDVAATVEPGGGSAAGGASMGAVTYLGGLGFYLLAPATALAAGLRIGASGLPDGEEAGLAVRLAQGGVVIAELLQAWSHMHLRGLRASPGPRYKLPSSGPFRGCVCPHYLAEAGFYWALAAFCIAQPEGHGAAPAAAMAAAALWTTSNLCVTGRRTLGWYRDTFGREAVGGRGVMLPLL